MECAPGRGEWTEGLGGVGAGQRKQKMRKSRVIQKQVGGSRAFGGPSSLKAAFDLTVPLCPLSSLLQNLHHQTVFFRDFQGYRKKDEREKAGGGAGGPNLSFSSSPASKSFEAGGARVANNRVGHNDFSQEHPGLKDRCRRQR